MKEAITSRVGRIISGSFNALVDAVENAAPEVVMEQAIREIDGAIEDVRDELGHVIASKHMANSRLMQVNQKCEDLSGKAELAVTENRDDLAEAAISMQLDVEAQIPILEAQIAELSSQEKELEGYVAALQGKKREMNDELRLYRQSVKEAEQENRRGTAGSGSDPVGNKVRKAQSAFDRIVNRQTGLPGTPGVDPKTVSQMNELEDLSRKNRIQERLAAVKSSNKA
jgi:phage shock protein A